MEDPKKPRDKQLVYASDDVSLVRLARKKGLSDEKIILELTRGEDYQRCLAIAKKYAPVMGIKVSEFMVMAQRRKP